MPLAEIWPLLPQLRLSWNWWPWTGIRVHGKCAGRESVGSVLSEEWRDWSADLASAKEPLAEHSCRFVGLEKLVGVVVSRLIKPSHPDGVKFDKCKASYTMVRISHWAKMVPVWKNRPPASSAMSKTLTSTFLTCEFTWASTTSCNAVPEKSSASFGARTVSTCSSSTLRNFCPGHCALLPLRQFCKRFLRRLHPS